MDGRDVLSQRKKVLPTNGVAVVERQHGAVC